jgi:EmrB/QacA subfamily drug resistance transporter
MSDATGLHLNEASGRWVLAAAVMGSAVAMLDSTVINVALPRLGRDLGADFAGLQWVVNGYTLVLASLILVGGSLGDRLGRKRVFVVGVSWFALASLLCGIAPSVGFLVAARVLQGVGGALLTPGSLAILQSSIAKEDRGRAIGAWSGLGGVAAAVGPFLGGWLVDAASWRWVFLVNLPVAIAVVIVAIRHVPESRDPTITGHVDLGGAALGSVGLAAATYGLIERSLPIGVTGAVLVAAFVVYEGRTAHPMLPLGIFANVRFSATNAVTFVVYAALGMLLFLLGITLQSSLGYSPLAAGSATFPLTLIMLVGSSRAGALAQRIGPRLPMTLGPAIIALGLLLLTRIDIGGRYPTQVLPGIIVFGVGLALTVAPLTATVLASADERHAGVASGVNNAVARTAGLLAVAALPFIAGFDPRHVVAPETLITALRRAAFVAAGLCLVGAALSWTFVRADSLSEAPGDATPFTEEAPTFHCGTAGPPLVVSTRT